MNYRRPYIPLIILHLLVSTLSIAGGFDFTPHGTQPGQQFQMPGSSTDFRLSAPGDCQACHEGFSSPDTSFMPLATWSGSMMSNSARDPLFWAALDVANNDAPGSGEFCLRCHAPDAWLSGRIHKVGNGAATVEGSDGCLMQGELDKPYSGLLAGQNDFAGVHCEVCHRIMPSSAAGETAPLENANLWIDDQACPQGGSNIACRRGPYKQLNGEFHGWAYSPLHERSEICGSCHNVTSPTHNLINEIGVDTGLRFPIERTFEEWKLSELADILFLDSIEDDTSNQDTATTCQNCHMPDSNDPSARACVLAASGSRVDDLPVHSFLGPNSFVLGILSGEYSGVSQLNNQSALNENIMLSEAFITTAASLEVTASPPPASIPGTINASVKVTNLSGHKLPTGYSEGRRMWLQLEVMDANNNLVFSSGDYDPTTAELTIDPQIRIYETLQGIWDNSSNSCVTEDSKGNALFHFVLNNCIAKDNRIPPLGFRGGNSQEVKPVAANYPETFPGSGKLVNFDSVNYAIPVTAATVFPIAINATLLYQTSSKDYIEFLVKEANDNAFPNDCVPRSGEPSPTGINFNQSRAAIAEAMWSAYGKSTPETVATDKQSVNRLVK